MITSAGRLYERYCIYLFRKQRKQDGGYIASLSDVIVDPEYQGRGIGKVSRVFKERFASEVVEDSMFLKKYRLGFDVWALVLLLIIMIPNFIWFKVPAPNDILREESVTVVIDTIASIFQAVMIICLCIVLNKDKAKFRITKLLLAVMVYCLFYYFCWILYYFGVVNAGVMYGLAFFPCSAFFLFALDRKNMIAIVPVLIFTICHLTYAVVNYCI